MNLYKKNFETALYTLYDLEKVPKNILEKLKYLKVGKYTDTLRIQEKFYGSSNQKFYSLEKGEIVNES